MLIILPYRHEIDLKRKNNILCWILGYLYNTLRTHLNNVAFLNDRLSGPIVSNCFIDKETFYTGWSASVPKALENIRNKKCYKLN